MKVSSSKGIRYVTFILKLVLIVFNCSYGLTPHSPSKVRPSLKDGAEQVILNLGHPCMYSLNKMCFLYCPRKFCNHYSDIIVILQCYHYCNSNITTRLQITIRLQLDYIIPILLDQRFFHFSDTWSSFRTIFAFYPVRALRTGVIGTGANPRWFSRGSDVFDQCFSPWFLCP